jgi:hypothetical protein
MKQYKILQRTVTESVFNNLVKTQFEEKLNELSLDGWQVKSFDINVIKEEEAVDDKYCVNIYALLERETS